MLVLSFENCTMAMQNVNIRGNWVRVYRNSMYYFCNISVNLKLFQNKKFLKKNLSLTLRLTKLLQYYQVKEIKELLCTNPGYPFVSRPTLFNLFSWDASKATSSHKIHLLNI